MTITEVSILFPESHKKPTPLRAFASVTIDGLFTIHEMKVIQGPKGLFVCMPARKVVDSCPTCNAKNVLKARYCGECGHRLAMNRIHIDSTGRQRTHIDIAHPINAKGRVIVEHAVMKAYHEAAALRLADAIVA